MILTLERKRRQEKKLCDTIDLIDVKLSNTYLDQSDREALEDEKNKYLWQLVKLGLMPTKENLKLVELQQLEGQLVDERKSLRLEINSVRKQIERGNEITGSFL